MTDLEIILIIMLTAVTLTVLCYIVEDYIYTKKSEELKRKEELRLIKRDIQELKMRQSICTTDAEGLIKFINSKK